MASQTASASGAADRPSRSRPAKGRGIGANDWSASSNDQHGPPAYIVGGPDRVRQGDATISNVRPADVAPSIRCSASSSLAPVRLRRGQSEGHAFRSLARAICFQQLAGPAAAAIHRRTVAAVGGELSPTSLLATPAEDLRGAGFVAGEGRVAGGPGRKVGRRQHLPSTPYPSLGRRGGRAPIRHRPRHRALDGPDVPALRTAAARCVASR
jgi:hypothetical protein